MRWYRWLFLAALVAVVLVAMAVSRNRASAAPHAVAADSAAAPDTSPSVRRGCGF